MFTKKPFNVNGFERLTRRGNVARMVAASGMIVAAGCGGGGGGTSTTPVPTPVPTATPVPVVTPTPTVAARDRAIAANFSPNYIPADSKRYLHWANQQSLRVFVHPSMNNIVDRGAVNNIDASRARSAVRDALDNWTDASTSDFRFSIVDRVEDAEIEIYFVDGLRNLQGNSVSGVGIANYRFSFPNSNDSSRGVLENAVVQVVAGQPDVNLTDTIAHEIGHALGIVDHSDDAGDLLFPTALPPTVITQRDQNTLFFLYYSPDAVITRKATTPTKRSVSYRGEILCIVK